ncbi:hypothetical protein MJD09_01215, partial [bacterium]|nr:hypothetical protein [bacterium]
FLIIGIGIINKQLHFIQNTNLGFELERRLVIPVPLPNQNNLRVRTVELLKQEYAQETGVINVASASSVPGQLRGITSIRREGTPEDQYNELAVVFVDHEYIETMGIEVLEGRNFVKGSSVDSTEAFILNEKALEQLGLTDGVGERVIWRSGVIQNPNSQTRNGQIIGVIRDMHYEPFYRRIEPMLLMILPQANSNLIVEVSSQNISNTIAALERIWERLVPTRSFHYTFLDDDLGKLYESEQSLNRVIRAFTGLAIFIACLGLFGLASFTAEQRTKEIGIRKVLGASVLGVIALLSKEFTKLVVVSNLIAWPAAFFIMKDWLQNFYYRTSMGWEWFILGAVIVMAIALLTVSYQAIKAALINPVEALRYE